MDTSDPRYLEGELAEDKRKTTAKQRTERQRDAQRPHPRGPRRGHMGEKHPSPTFDPSRESVVRPATHIAYTNASGRRT